MNFGSENISFNKENFSHFDPLYLRNWLYKIFYETYFQNQEN